MRILAIGDPHGDLDSLKKIPLKNVDLILLTGDLGKADFARKISFENQKRKQEGLPKLKETKEQKKAIYKEIHYSTINILKYLSKHAPVYTIQGNVGIPTRARVTKDEQKYGIKFPCAREKINSMTRVHLVKNRLRIINGIRIGFLEYFTDVCWVKEFKPKDYKKSMKKAKKETEKARKVLKNFDKVDILVCHQPPYGILDKVTNPAAPKFFQGKHAGSKVILNYIKQKQPKYVFCGHIHEAKGNKKIGKTKIFNLGVADYKIINL